MGTSMKITLIYAPVIIGGGGSLSQSNWGGLQRFQCKNDNRTQAFSAKRSMVHIDTGAGVGWGGVGWGGRLSHRFSVQKGQGNIVVLVQKGQEA